MKKRIHQERNRRIAVFSSFEEENNAEYLRCARMTPAQRLDESAILQKRARGGRRTKSPMKKIFSVERVSW